MGKPGRPNRVKLFCGFFAADAAALADARDRLARIFGRIDYESPVLDFTQTDYYAAEFGGGLKRQFVTFARSFTEEGIYKAKLATNRLEERSARDGRRTVNFDPGYVTLSKVVLLTTKDYTHRLYLARGIYAEVTLHYRDRTFAPWPWTYPDYRTGGYIELFNAVRDRFHREVQEPC